MRIRPKRSLRPKRLIKPRTPLIQNRKKVLTLASALPNKKYRIVSIDGGCRLNSKLCAMGLMPDEEFNVYVTSRGGPVCISIKGSKFAIGRGMTQKIIIEEI